ncbi:retrovirus-related Pol polyprotein from transposon 412 [Trichonephila clavipes]|nr:retrovirus-related Pol polyprotein from transposon 412 [Trichonephila clavipes]
MTENDAPESTRARIGFLSIITSSWLPVILAVDGGFQYTRPHLLGRSLSLVFLAPTAWRLTGSAIWRRGSVTTYWGSASRGTWGKTARRVWSAYFLQCQRRRSSVGGFESCQRQPFSLGSSALHVQGAVFRSRLVSSLVDLCNIDHRFTTAYHPQTNGLTECFNKTLADMLSMYVDVEQEKLG